MSVMMVQTKRKLNHWVIPQTVPYSEQRNGEKKRTTKEQQLENWQSKISPK